MDICVSILLVDVLLLADVFEEFRRMALTTYKLDRAFMLTSSHLSFDAMLRKSLGKLELISDPAMFQMIEGGISGSSPMITTRFGHANNEGIGQLDEPCKPVSTIKGLDAKNLSG